MELDSEGLDSPVKVIACQEAGNSDVYEVEKITGMRLVKGKLWFRVRWKGYGADMATWEPRVNLNCEELLDDYVSKVQDKKYKQKKRRQTRNALIHSREKELKKGVNHVVKNKVPFNGPIRRKRFIRKFISKPNRCFKQMAQTKWPVNGGHLETDSATKLVDLPLETATEKEPVDLPVETATEKEPVDLPLETAKEKEPRRGARGRGRPKKNPVKMPDLQPQTQLCPDREPLETVDDVIILENNSIPEQKLETVVKRSRGRPPKRRITEQEEQLPVQSDLYGQERPKDIVKKRGRPKKVVADEGVTKETTRHPYNGQIKLKKVVIRELRSLKALLEFQRQISDEEKENHTDTYPKEEDPSSMENRHVLATEYRKRFYIRIKTGSFKDQSEKRRRKRKEHKEKRRKKKEAVQMKVQTDGDKEKNGLVDKQRVCDEIKDRCRSPDVMEIGSSEVENRDEDSVESQLHAPALNEEYDQFGYDDFVDFSKENNHVRDKREIEDDADAEPTVPQVSEEMDIDGREMPRDEIVAIESDTVLSAPNLRPERLVEEDAVTEEEEKIEEEDEEEEARAADDESSSLVIPFDEEEEEEEESSSLIICEDDMEDDDDDDDDDDLREFEIENNANQEPQTAITESFTTGSMDNVEKEITVDATRVDDQELRKAEHCEKSSEDVDSDEFIIEEKSIDEETESKQKEMEATNLKAALSNDSLREEILSKLFERECNCGKNEDMNHLDREKDAVTNVVSGKLVFTEEGSHKLDEKQDSQIDAAVEIVNEDQIERGDANSGPIVPLETENEVQVSISAKDKIDIEDEELIRTSRMEEEECAKEVIKSGIISKTGNEEADSLEGMETVANIERMEEESCESKEEREGEGDQIEPPTTVLSKGKATEEETRRDDDKIESDLVIMKEREIHQNDSQEGEKQMEDVKKEEEADGVKTPETSSKVAQDVVEVHNSTDEITVEQNFAVEGMDSRIAHEEADDDGSTVKGCVEQMEEKCKGNKEEERATNIDLIEPEVEVPSEGMEMEAKGQVEDKELESETKSPHECMEDETSKENLEETLEENCAVEMMNPGIFPVKMDKEMASTERQGKEVCVEESEEEFEMEEEREIEDDLAEPQVKSTPEAQELERKVQADDRHMESEDAVTQEEEFDMEEERELEDDLVEPKVKSIPEAQELKGKLQSDDRHVELEGTVTPEEFEMEEEREVGDDLVEPLVKSIPKAQELERKVHADDRHMEPEEVEDDLVKPQVKSTPEAPELERLVQADDRHMEPEDAVTQEEEFIMEDKRKVRDDLAEPQMKSVLEAQELEREAQADDRHMEPEDAVTQQEEFVMEDERKVKDDLAEPPVKSVPEAQELEREVQADDRHMESGDSVTQEEEFDMEGERKVKDDLAEPQVKSVPEAQELEREVQADDKHMESGDSVTQEEKFVMEDERKVKDDLAEPQVKSVPEAQELEKEVQADDRHMKSEDSVTQEEEFVMEDKREVIDGLAEPQVKNLPEAQELEREVQADIRQMEPEDSVTQEMAEKVVHMDEETDHTKNVGDVPLRASNDMQPDTTAARESDKIKDDHGEHDKEEINKELKETESQMSGVQENRQKELENNEGEEQKNDIPPQRDIESLKPELELSLEMESEEKKAEGEACHEKMEEKEGTAGGKEREEVACDDKMEEKGGTEVQLKSMEIEGKAHAEGEKESEMAVAMETMENTLRREEEVEHEINNVPQREDDKISPDFTTSKETDLECSDHGEQDVERRKMNDEEKKSEIGGASEIADKELKMVEELESDVNNMPQRDTKNLEPDLPLTKERDIEENDHQEEDRKQVGDQKEEQKTDRLRTSGAISAMAGDAVDSRVKNEMEVEEKEGQMDCETVSPENDETGCHEGGDELSMATTTEEEKMVTSTKESVKDQVMRKEDDQEVDKELNSGKEEAAETVKEQVVEFGDHQNMDAQELPDLLLKDNKNVEHECDVDKSVAESEGEVKTSEDEENKSKEGDRALESCEEATATEVSTAEDSVHSVVEDKGQDLETGKRSGGENIEGIIEICTKGNHNEDKESIHGAETELRNEDKESIHKAGTELRNEDKESIHGAETELRNEDKESIHSAETELGNELLKEKQVEEEMANSYNSMGDRDEVPLIVTKTDVEEEENNEIKSVDRRAEIEIIDEGIVDEQENRCSNDKQTPFPDKMGNAKNRTSGNEVPVIVTKTDVVEKENDDIKPVDRKAAIEITDEGIADEQENRCGIDKQMPFPDKMGKAKNTVSENLEGIQQLVMEEKVEVTGKVLNGSRPSIQEVDQQEKIELNVGRKKTDAGDGLKMMGEEELEEGEIPDDEEEEREDDDKDDDKEEGEIMEETEDVAEERGRADEIGEKTQPLAEKSKDTDQNSEKEFSNSQKVEPMRRRSQEAIEIAKTSSINSDLRTNRHVAERTMTTRSSAITMKRNFNGAYSSREHKRAKTLEPTDTIAVDDEDDDDVEVVESNIHPKKVSQSSNDKNSAESDVYIIDEEPARSAGAKPHDNRSNFSEHVSERTVNSEQNSEALSPKFGAGLKKVSPASSWHVGRKDKTGSNARRMVQSMKDHLLRNVSNSQESGENGQTVIKNSSCKAHGFKPKDSFAKEGRENLFKRLEGPGSDDAGTRTGKSGTKRKSDDDDDDDSGSSGSKTQPKKKLAGISGKEVWRMVPRKEKKPTEPIWEGNTKINRQKIVIKISKVHLPDQHGTKELEDNSKRKESEKSEKSSSHNGWKEGRKAEKTSEDKGCHGGLQANGVKEEQKEKREKTSLNVRDRRATSTSTDATGRWSAVPDAKLDNKTGSETGRKSRRASETNSKPDLLKDLKELKTHGIKQSDLPWVRDLLETDHAECLSEACAALTKFMDSKDHKINLVVEMGFCPMLVKLLRSRSAEVVSSALLAVSHIVSGNDYQTQAVLECSPLPLFSSFLSRHKHDVMLRKEACLALSNITAGTSQQIQHLVNDGLFPVLLSVMQHDEAQVMYEATWAVANATVNGSPEQIRYIVKQGFFQAFSEVLKHTDDTLIQIALDAMYNVLKLDAKNKKPGKPTPYCRQVKEFGGLERIRSVRQTGSTVVKKKADNMLRTFFCDL